MLFGPCVYRRSDEPIRIGRPSRDRGKTKAARRAARKNRR